MNLDMFEPVCFSQILRFNVPSISILLPQWIGVERNKTVNQTHP